MRNSPKTQHRSSAGQDAQNRLTHVPLPIALGTCWLLKMVLRLISTPFYSHLIPHTGSVMLRTHTTMMIMHRLMQLLTVHSPPKSVLTTGQAP